MGKLNCFFYVFVFLLSSCGKEYSTYTAVDGGADIEFKDSGIEKIRNRDWRISVLGKEVVSKGITVTLEMPKLVHSKVSEVMKSVEADSWIVRVTAQTKYSNKVIAYLASSMLVDPRTQVRFGNVNLYYKAAAELRYQDFSCPPYGHDYYIGDDDFDVKTDERNGVRIIKGRKNFKEQVHSNVIVFGSKTATINVGETVVGSFFFEAALYNSISGLRKSNFVRFDEYAQITKETHRPIKGCSNFKIPPKDFKKKKNTVEYFRFDSDKQ